MLPVSRNCSELFTEKAGLLTLALQELIDAHYSYQYRTCMLMSVVNFLLTVQQQIIDATRCQSVLSLTVDQGIGEVLLAQVFARQDYQTIAPLVFNLLPRRFVERVSFHVETWKLQRDI